MWGRWSRVTVAKQRRHTLSVTCTHTHMYYYYTLRQHYSHLFKFFESLSWKLANKFPEGKVRDILWLTGEVDGPTSCWCKICSALHISKSLTLVNFVHSRLNSTNIRYKIVYWMWPLIMTLSIFHVRSYSVGSVRCGRVICHDKLLSSTYKSTIH